ncbi:MAG: recombination regulator RecX [Clostridia bacterium]|nr:recombination regulator RecX [Clostridia bacterium]
MEITAIERNKKNKDRMSVYIDGQYTFSISEEEFLRLHLYDKKDITAEEVDYIQNDLNFRNAKSTAIRFLSLKYRSEMETGVKLENEGFDNETIEKVLAELKSMGYINDKIYAQKYIFDRSKLKPKAKKMLRYELEAKGISQEILDEVLENWELDEASIAAGLIKKKFGKYDLDDEKILYKAKAFLHHRGFCFSIIEEAIRSMKEEDYRL